MKRRKKNAEDSLTERIAVTDKLFIFLWTLKIQWHSKRLNDVIVRLVKMAGFVDSL